MRLRTRYTQRLPIAPGLRLDIPMFEGSGTKVLDLSGKGNHGTITDAVWTRDENGVAMSFNGTSAYIDCGNDASLNITDAITLEVWIKPVDLTGRSQDIISKYNLSGNLQYLLMFSSVVADLRLYIGGGGSGNYAETSSGVIHDKWLHVVGLYDGTDTKLYTNGEWRNDAVNPLSPVSCTTNLFLGQRSGGTAYFDGTIDEVRIYNRALSAAEIKRRYEQTKRDYVRAS